uniref:hypothetical protein n=1 Tax=Polaromonas sp. E5S TaxID=1840267 RepID=UPI0015E8087F|nr:hypothetical protein [Polaromonas sp. E5S]
MNSGIRRRPAHSQKTLRCSTAKKTRLIQTTSLILRSSAKSKPTNNARFEAHPEVQSKDESPIAEEPEDAPQ